MRKPLDRDSANSTQAYLTAIMDSTDDAIIAVQRISTDLGPMVGSGLALATVVADIVGDSQQSR